MRHAYGYATSILYLLMEELITGLLTWHWCTKTFSSLNSGFQMQEWDRKVPGASVFSFRTSGAVAGAGLVFSLIDALCSYDSMPSLKKPRSHCLGLCTINHTSLGSQSTYGLSQNFWGTLETYQTLCKGGTLCSQTVAKNSFLFGLGIEHNSI